MSARDLNNLGPSRYDGGCFAPSLREMAVVVDSRDGEI